MARPTDDIPEITPEMIEAGGRAVRLETADEIGYSMSKLIAEAVLRAALQTQLSGDE